MYGYISNLLIYLLLSHPFPYLFSERAPQFFQLGPKEINSSCTEQGSAGNGDPDQSKGTQDT